MNDRFKFRVWDIEDCTYFEPRDFDDLWLNENAELRVGFYSDATQMIEDYTDNVIIEQCTGLKDKNGNPIYEGDVVRCSDGNIYNICWSDSAMIIIAVNTITKIGYDIYKLKCYDDFEIIGNIHEQTEQKD